LDCSFVPSWGLDRAAAKRAFSQFIEERQLTGSQLDFVNLIIDHLTQCGWMRPEQLYSSPFTDEFSAGPNTVFTEQQTVQALISTLSVIQQNASGAVSRDDGHLDRLS
jgi:type I restriction enzyme R subunit